MTELEDPGETCGSVVLQGSLACAARTQDELLSSHDAEDCHGEAGVRHVGLQRSWQKGAGHSMHSAW